MLAPRDELIFLLQTASEIEHSLMAQYLYAAWSVPPGIPQGATGDAEWSRRLMRVAKQEMGHLVTVQNVLRSLNAPLTLDRQDYPFRTDLYPFDFKLERVTLHSLAKYVLAEMPANPVFPAGVTLQEVKTAAGMGAGDVLINRVGLLFEKLTDLVGGSTITDADFDPSSVPKQANADRWRADGANDVIVLTVANKADALLALKAIADQGEGPNSPAAGAPPSHFDIFATLFKERRDIAADPVALVPENPNTSPLPGLSPLPAPDENAAGRILHRRSRLWALLGNIHYRMLLSCIRHSISLENDDAGPENTVREQAFDEMKSVGRLGGLLARLPLVMDASPARAGMPLEMPYSLDFPDTAKGIWLMHRDLLMASAGLIRQLEAEAGLTGEETALLAAIKGRDAAFRLKVDGFLGGAPTAVTTIHALRILPSLAIARFGSSPQPLDNYELGSADNTGWRPVAGAETLTLDETTGEISGASTPAAVKFRDALGRIRPVCPFLEVWAQFSVDGPLQPLTAAHLQQLGLTAASLKWRVRVANLKAVRRTGAAADGINADTGDFSDHASRALVGLCPNFKAGKNIPFGAVRFVKPNVAFPEIRLRFTPAHGRVFGPTAGDPNVSDDVYDAARGGWDSHFDGRAGTPLNTEPGAIFFGQERTVGGSRQWVSRAYLDDACDGIVSVELTLPGATAPLRTTARISAGPPHFSPDTLPVRAVADELEQWLQGPEITGTLSATDAEALGQRAADIIRRALGTVRLMNTDAMNVGGMAGHDQGTGRAGEPIFPVARAAYVAVEDRHRRVLAALNGLSAAPGSTQRMQAIGALQTMADILRQFDQVGDLTNDGRRRMPAMMRGADGLHLAVTRRQRDTIVKAAAALSGPAATTPEQEMVALINLLAPAGADRHDAVSAGASTLDTLFADPPSLLAYLRGQPVKKHAPLAGQPLVIAGNPNGSAFIKIIETPTHPMFIRFNAVQPSLGGKTGAQIARNWVASLPTTPVV